MGLLKNIVGAALTQKTCDVLTAKIDKWQLESLEKLEKLYQNGTITEKEYKRKKKDLMGR